MRGRLVWVVLLVETVVLADVNVMKDVTLGFGQALEKCRDEVCILRYENQR